MEKKFVFFIGGADAEMVEIIKVLANAGAEMINNNLGWGASASAYVIEIAAAVAAGKVLVLIELIKDIELPESTILVDHHGDRSSEPASILQVLSLLGLEPNRWQLLIAANDSGYIPGMLAIGATPEEVASVRLADRSAQGIMPEQEAAAEEAIAGREVAGRLTIVHLPHSKCATVTDRLFGQYDQLLILSGDGEVNFFGDGQLCAVLKEKFEGWNGGSGLGQRGGSAYWGGYPDQVAVENFICETLRPRIIIAVLTTNKKNYLVNNNEECYAFFDQFGKFLRIASPQEWDWAKTRMEGPEESAEIPIFDFTVAMSIKKIAKLERAAAIKIISEFVGTENLATILSVFNGNPKDIKIRGQMKPDWRAMAVSTGGQLYSSKEWVNCWALGGHKFLELANIMLEESAEQNPSGSCSPGYGFNAEHLAKAEYAEYGFFLVNEGYRYNGDRIEEGESWAIYSRPNLQPIWDERRKIANKKLNSFLGETRGVKSRDLNNFRRIIREVGVTDLEIDSIKTAIISQGWSVELTSDYGEMYTDKHVLKVWAVNPDFTATQVHSKNMNPGQRGPTPYGYTFKYLKKQAPAALFFVMKEEHHRSADRQPSYTWDVWHLLRPLNDGERLAEQIKKNNHSNRAATLADMVDLSSVDLKKVFADR